jgi:hypothetical protein
MKKLFLAIILFTVFTAVKAQITQTIRGKILDKESHTTLIGANVLVLNSNPVNGTMTDVDGNFKLVVPVGRVTLRFTYIGYEDMVVPELLVISGKETFLNIEMRESISTMQEVVVKAQKDKIQPLNSMASVSARMLSTEDASRYAGGYNDPARMVSSFAGVSPAQDDKNDIIVRGNSPRGLLWRLEGVEIPSPAHFSDGEGDSGGSFCILSSSVLSNSDFYTGAFPAEYGNALSGILDLNLRKGNSEKHEFGFQAGVVGVEGSIEGPVRAFKGGSYLINYRYSNFQALNKMGLLDLSDNAKAPQFQDLVFNINLPTEKAGTFSFFGVGGTSTAGEDGVRDSVQWLEDENLSEDEWEKHYMGVIGLKHIYNFSNKKAYLKTNVSGTYLSDVWDWGDLITNGDVWYKGSRSGDYTRFRNRGNEFSYPSVKFSTLLNHKINASHTIRTGFNFSILKFNIFDEKYNWDKSADENRAVYDVRVNKKETTSLSEVYLQWKYRISQSFEINTGVHSLLFHLNNHYSVEPRAGLKWYITDKSSINYGFGIHSKVEAISAYYSIVSNPDGSLTNPNKNVNFTRAIHNVLGYDLSISPNLRLKAEVYYQYLYDIPIKNDSNSTESSINATYGIPDTAYNNLGLGINKGMELTLEKFYSNDYYFLVTFSMFDSKYKAGNGKWYNTYFNGNYVTNWLVGKDFKVGASKQNIFGLNTKLLLRGGYRYTPFDMARSDDDAVYDYSRTFMEQMPYYMRLDFGIKYRRNNPRYSWIISLDIQNFTGRKNILGYEYREQNGKKWTENVEGLGLIPILNFRIEF